MTKNLSVLCVIPARGGSKGVPRKNIRMLAGKPMIAYPIAAAHGARLVTRVIVSTDDDEIAHVARSCGADVPFMRPRAIATDDVSVTAVAQHAMKFFEERGERYDAILSFQVSSPLTTSGDIDACVQKMIDTGCDAVISMKVLEEVHPWRIYRMQGDRVEPFSELTNENFPQRQDRPPAHKFSGAIYLRRRHLLETWNGVDFALGHDRRGILIPQARTVDINTLIDFMVAEALIQQGVLQQ